MIEKILIRVPQTLKTILQETAKKKGTTVNQLILQILWEWTEKKNYIRKETEMKREQTTIRLTQDLMDRLQCEADRKGYTVKDLITFILWGILENSVQG